MEKCVKCRKEFEPEVKEKEIIDDVKQLYYECPYCDNYTPGFRVNNRVKYTDASLRKLLVQAMFCKDVIKRENYVTEYRHVLTQRFNEIKQLSRR